MKKLAILVLLALELAVGGCGNSTSTTTTTTDASGNWEAQLTGGVGQASLLDFVTAFTVNNSGPLSITGFSFINTGTCFVSGEVETGTATLTTDSTNQVTGTVTYTVQSGTPAGNTLTLTGNVTGTNTSSALSGGAVTGTWTLTGGTGCTGSGNFTMCQNATTCSTT
jgi:hypothetical protein